MAPKGKIAAAVVDATGAAAPLKRPAAADETDIEAPPAKIAKPTEPSQSTLGVHSLSYTSALYLMYTGNIIKVIARITRFVDINCTRDVS